ncbi:hypothetical protein D3C81_1716360 [compost metagenome]
MFSGVSPSDGNQVLKRGISPLSANTRLAVFCSPGGIRYLTITKFIRLAAMKLNMMVVTTIWLPRLACR